MQVFRGFKRAVQSIATEEVSETPPPKAPKVLVETPTDKAPVPSSKAESLPAPDAEVAQEREALLRALHAMHDLAVASDDVQALRGMASILNGTLALHPKSRSSQLDAAVAAAPAPLVPSSGGVATTSWQETHATPCRELMRAGSEEPWEPPASVIVGDCLIGQLADKDISIRFVTRDDATSLSARLFIRDVHSGSQAYNAAISLSQEDPTRLRWKLVIKALDGSIELEGLLRNGAFKGNMMRHSGSDSSFSITRDRDPFDLSHIRRRPPVLQAAPWQKASAVGDGAWNQYVSTLTQLLSFEELNREGVPQLNAWRTDLGKLDADAKALKAERMVLVVGSSGAGKSKMLSVALALWAMRPGTRRLCEL